MTNVQEELEGAGFTGANETHTTTEPITPGEVFGYYVDNESDYYSLTITEPSILKLEVLGHRAGGTTGIYFDPLIRPYDTDGTSQFALRDATFYYDDPQLEYDITTPGTYFIEVNECCNDADAPYRLSVEVVPAPIATMEAEPSDSVAEANTVGYRDRLGGTVTTGLSDFWSFDGEEGDALDRYSAPLGLRAQEHDVRARCQPRLTRSREHAQSAPDQAGPRARRRRQASS